MEIMKLSRLVPSAIRFIRDSPDSIGTRAKIPATGISSSSVSIIKINK
jgi:hypothetical protein